MPRDTQHAATYQTLHQLEHELQHVRVAFSAEELACSNFSYFNYVEAVEGFDRKLEEQQNGTK